MSIDRRNLHKLKKEAEKAFEQKRCMHWAAPAECSGCISRAHTISRSGTLSAIADNGHVLSFPRDEVYDQHPDRPRLTLRGVRSASTFSGFCALHDRSTFEVLDRKSFDGTAQYAHLLAYRTLTRELFMKENYPSVHEFIASTSGQASAATEYSEVLGLGMSMGARDLRSYRIRIQKVLAEAADPVLKTVALRTEATIPFACAASFNPEYDVRGRHLFDMTTTVLSEEPVPLCFLHILPTPSGTDVLISWFAGDRRGHTLARSIAKTPSQRVASTLLSYAMAVSDNVHIKPSWWEKVPCRMQRRLQALIDVGQPTASSWFPSSDTLAASLDHLLPAELTVVLDETREATQL